MTTNTLTLELEPRSVLGKKVKQLRRAGITPVHIYGSGFESRALQCNTRRLLPVLARAGNSSPIMVSVAGENGQIIVFVRDLHWAPTRNEVLHVDLLATRSDEPITAEVTVNLEGEAPAAHSGAQVVQQLYAVTVEALPLEMPSEFTIDISNWTDANENIRVADIKLPANITLITELEEVVARIEQPRGEEQPAEAEAEEKPSEGQ